MYSILYKTGNCWFNLFDVKLSRQRELRPLIGGHMILKINRSEDAKVSRKTVVNQQPVLFDFITKLVLSYIQKASNLLDLTKKGGGVGCKGIWITPPPTPHTHKHTHTHIWANTQLFKKTSRYWFLIYLTKYPIISKLGGKKASRPDKRMIYIIFTAQNGAFIFHICYMIQVLSS